MRSLFFAFALVAGVLAPATSANASLSASAPKNSIGVHLVDAPTNRKNDPRAQNYIVDHLKPGATISRRIEVSNGTAKPQTVALYAAAASISNGGWVVADARTQDELSSWTSVDRSTIPLPPGGSGRIRVTIKVPNDATSGERYAVVWAEIRSATPAGGGVIAVNRVGIRIYLSVGPGGEPPSNFTIDTLTARRLPGGEPVVTAQVHNTGGRALDMSGTLKLTDGPGDLTAGPFPATLGTSLRVGQTAMVTIPLHRALPDGPWHARIDLKSGLLARSAEGQILFPKAGAAAPVKVKPVAHPVAWWLILALVAGFALLLGLVIWFILWRRGRRRLDEDDDDSTAQHRAPVSAGPTDRGGRRR